MKILKFLLTTTLFIAMIMSFASVTYAASAITINDVTFEEYVDEYGSTDESLVTVKVSFTMSSSSEQISFLLTSENITEISDTTKSKIIYMSQDVTPDGGVYEFAIEKSKVISATGLTDIDGCTLYVKVGGKDVADMATKTVTYYDPTASVKYGDVTGEGDIDIGDAVQVLRYEAGLTTFDSKQKVAADVTGEGDIDIGDAVKILRFEAGLVSSIR